jgi:hypothetical protein
MHSELYNIYIYIYIYIYASINKIKRDNVPSIQSKLLFELNSQIIEHRTEGQE